MAEIENGQTVSAEEIERDLTAWLTESDSHNPPGRTYTEIVRYISTVDRLQAFRFAMFLVHHRALSLG